ncbi:MAG: hypothetical protein MMC33_008546 [Icmadophila ericetorum]|nr:hypothetical protein [Icmadophila ericetorum]
MQEEENEKVQYTHLVQRLDLDDGSSMELGLPSQPAKSKRNLLQRGLSICMIALVLFLAILGSTNLTQRALYVDPQSKSCSCGGTNITEALRRGCRFTPLAIAWLPEHCIDQELSDEFDRSGDGPNGTWQYWSDPHRRYPITWDQMAILADNETGYFFTTQNWHVTHCTFTWRKHYRQKETGVTIERRSNGLDHIAHCESIFRIRSGLQDIMTVAGIALDADDPGETLLSQVGKAKAPSFD